MLIQRPVLGLQLATALFFSAAGSAAAQTFVDQPTIVRQADGIVTGQLIEKRPVRELSREPLSHGHAYVTTLYRGRLEVRDVLKPGAGLDGVEGDVLVVALVSRRQLVGPNGSGAQDPFPLQELGRWYLDRMGAGHRVVMWDKVADEQRSANHFGGPVPTEEEVLAKFRRQVERVLLEDELEAALDRATRRLGPARSTHLAEARRLFTEYEQLAEAVLRDAVPGARRDPREYDREVIAPHRERLEAAERRAGR